jgi:8-oxo-dGTP diphosphatase
VGDALAVDEAGNALVAFYPVAEETRFDDAPLPLALVALWHGDRLLVVFNRFRQSWELPGGMIDPGETPRRAATRELGEEAGLQVDDLAFAGYALFTLGSERRAEYAALYTAETAPQDGFVPGDEISAICWWDGAQPLNGHVQMLDVTLGRLAREHAHVPPADQGEC